MALTSGERLGPYEIVEQVGSGGMGEVYRARDARLDRDVALKVLPQLLSSNPDFRQRFEREAKAISSLTHPNICALYDVGSQDGVDYLVMEFLEGETLAERLKRGPLSPERVRRFGMEIADALDKAHRQGIIHRDLKPGNIMLTPSGAKLMDFGLAKPGLATNGSSGLTAVPTQTTPLTAEGTIVGTFQYMSPEQVEGKEADARSDIFALGAVLYEMATGKRAFEGKTQISVMAAILEKDPPPLSDLQPLTPPALERLVQTCLKKDPEERLQSARDVKLHLQWVDEAGSRAGVPAPLAAKRKTRQRLAWGVAVAGLLLSAGLAVAYVRAASRNPPIFRASLLPPDKAAFVFDGATGGPVLSPDGTWIVFPAKGPTGEEMLWLRRMDSLAAQPLEGTEGASYPFWSPDSRFVCFFVPGKLRKIDSVGGPPQTLCDVPSGRGGSWSPEGVILFAPGPAASLQRVASAGGIPAPQTELNKDRQETSHRWPFFLPDGKHYLLWAGGPSSSDQASNGLYVGSLQDKGLRFLVRSDSDGVYCPQGYILYLRERSLMAQPFDAGSQKITGEAFPIAEGVTNPQNYKLGSFTASRDGTLVYQTGEVSRTATLWASVAGSQTSSVGEPDFIQDVRLSPDGLRLAETIQDQGSRNVNIWLVDLARDVKTRFTFTASQEIYPVWSPDGGRIAFVSNLKGHYDIYVKSATGAGEAEPLLVSDADNYVTDWSRDGRFLSVTRVDPKAKTQADLYVLPIDGSRKLTPFLPTPFDEENGVFSPDGRWLAYQSNESGKYEVYVTSFPQAGGKWQASKGGGVVPRWRHDGKGLFYRTLDGKLMEAPLSASGNAIELGTPHQIPGIQFPEAGPYDWDYDLTPKDDRVLLTRPENPTSTPLTLVTNWTEGIKR